MHLETCLFVCSNISLWLSGFLLNYLLRWKEVLSEFDLFWLKNSSSPDMRNIVTLQKHISGSPNTALLIALVFLKFISFTNTLQKSRVMWIQLIPSKSQCQSVSSLLKVAINLQKIRCLSVGFKITSYWFKAWCFSTFLCMQMTVANDYKLQQLLCDRTS